ncbi:MAG: DUF1925 domain-containing protein [Caldisericia bacterium]|jgi:alpha-amylase/alpha-mannosidase (GH57 family)|nr:DUF1925 domain-containing protein [Caldisericia bacterium]
MKYLLILIHNHQPIGNFKDVILNAFYKSYIPFLEKVLKYKNIKISLHTSGNLFEFMEEENIKDYEDLIKELLKENRIELFSGTFYEAILPLIPEEDKINQIKLMNRYLINKFNFTPKGMWLTERVWEPDIPKYISKCDIEYTLLDDNAFKKSFLIESDLFGYYITENEGFITKVFPILKKLRYLIPFRDINELSTYFNSFKEDNLIFVYGDDGEKFGLWPGTYEYVFKDGYLDKFFHFLNENDNIKTILFNEATQRFKPKGRVYLNISSYEEMEEWSDGFFRNFLKKYHESNKIHKRMLFMREIIDKDDFSIYKHLLKSQCNDAYWHGIFGGLYLPHLRESIFKEILEGEAKSKVKNEIKILDYDKDGFDEIIYLSRKYKLFIHRISGKVMEFDYFNKNISNVITRYRESYHEKLFKDIDYLKDENKIKTIHDIFTLKDKDALNYLKFDTYFKENFLIHFIEKEKDLENSKPYENILNYEIEKNKIKLFDNKISIEYHFLDSILNYILKCEKLSNLLVLELNLHFLEDKFELENDGIIIDFTDFKLKFKSESFQELKIEKIFTVSNSESGIEKIYQGSTIYFLYKLNNDINYISMEVSEVK